MRIVDSLALPPLASLYLAQLGPDPEKLAEFVDTLEPGVPKNEKWVMMVSTQFGCPVGCRMCDAGAMGYRGNLSAAQILGQIRHVVRENPGLDVRRHPKVKIHFARMGEPALNPDVLKALEMLAREFPYDGILPSLSTVAPKSPSVERFFEELLALKNSLYPGGRFQLQFSLHSTDEERRKIIVPIKKWSLEEVSLYGQRFVAGGDRKITLNFALAKGERLDPRRIDEVFSPAKFLVKITPVNPTEAAARRGAAHLWGEAPDGIKADAGELEALGFDVIISPSLPEEISAQTSCGQLWSAALKGRAATMLASLKRLEESYVGPENLNAKSRDWAARIAHCLRRSFELKPGKAGLLVMDMQELFLDPRSPSFLPPARAILGNVRALVQAFRGAGRPVYFTRHAHRDPAKDGGLMPQWWRSVCLDGTPEARISPALEPGKSRVLRKCRYSAFTNRSLGRILSRDGVEELAVCGVATNLCVESTIRDAFDRGFKTFVVLDATAARAEELHLAALKNLAHGFSTVLSAAQITAAIRSDHERNTAGTV
ncbi:MAG: isochorismatase family protein [Elusimicrobia bacterium]|nr:isochorismatase family protein [Elusimicrobiota bacterium]